MQQQTQKNDDNLRKKDNKINLPAICCALTAVFRLHQHLFHPWAAMNTVHCSTTQPYPTPSGQLHHVEKYLQKKQAGTICYTFLKNALKKRICRKKLSQKLFSRCFSNFVAVEKPQRSGGSFRYPFPQPQPRLFCLILR